MKVPGVVRVLQKFVESYVGRKNVREEVTFELDSDVPGIGEEEWQSIDDHPPPPRLKDGMGIVTEGPWAGMLQEVLAQVFDRLPFEDRLKTIPLVCKEWRTVARIPSVWRNVDMDSWMKTKADEIYYWDAEADMTGIVKAVVDLSQGQLRQLCTGYCTDKIVNYIAENCPMLSELSIRNSSTVSDESVMNLARKCNQLVKLDLSDCYKVSAKSLEKFGLNCHSLRYLSRNMIDIRHYEEVGKPRGDEEAIAIATYMTTLKELQMRRMTSLTDSGLMSIAKGCSQLEKLDLACCTSLSPKALDSVTDVCPKLRSFVRPIKARMHVADSKHHILGLYMVSY